MFKTSLLANNGLVVDLGRVVVYATDTRNDLF